MESVSCQWLLLSVLVLSWAHSALSAVDGLSGGKVRGVNLGNWLVIEGWMKLSLFQGIPEGDMLDGAKVRFRSLSLNKYVSAKDGGGSGVYVDQGVASTWETFRLWRVSQSKYQLRSLNGKFLSCTGVGDPVTATSEYPSLTTETFSIERWRDKKVRIKLSSGTYLQASSGNELKADYVGTPGWDDGNAAIFVMTFDGDNLQGEYQLSNGYGPTKAKQVLTEHRNNYVTREDFQYLSLHGINTVRIPVGWWIAKDPNPPAPYVGGSLAALNNAFQWAQEFDIKCIIDLHAAPGSQNGMDHSSSRDGSIDWMEPDNIQQSLEVIQFLAKTYGNHPALLGIELLNEPNAPKVIPDILKKYYKDGYDIVRKHSATAYVIMCQRVGGIPNPVRLYHAIASMNLSNVVFDLHYYNLYYDELFKNKSSKEHIDYINNERKHEIESLNAGLLVFIGEWVNQFGRGGWSQTEYQEYGSAQLNVFGSTTFGWAYWSLENVKHHWSLKWNIDNKYLQL